MQRLLEFVRRNKNKASTVWSALVAISVPVTIISGLPATITTAVKYGPDFFSSPNTWWAIGSFIVWLVVMRWIWRQPEEPAKLGPVKDALTAHMEKMIEDASPRQCRLMTLLAEVRHFERSVAETPIEEATVRYDINMLRVVFPSRITELLGEDFRRKYTQTLEHSIKKSNSLYIVTQTVVPLLTDKIIDALIEDTDKQVAAAQNRIDSRPAVAMLPSPEHKSQSAH